MSQTVITARITDQRIQIINQPVLIASGSEGVIQISFEFCSLWDGYSKTAVFYRDEKGAEIYHIQVEQGVATVPHEVLADAGGFYFGVFGSGDNTRTTEVIRLEIKQGAITAATAKPEDPTPNIYQQLLIAYDVAEGRINELVAMRNTNGNTEISFENEFISGTIKTNGIYAMVDFTISNLTLGAKASENDHIFFPDLIGSNLAPFGLGIRLHCYNKDFEEITDTAGIDVSFGYYGTGSEEPLQIMIWNLTSEEIVLDSISCTNFYNLAHPSILELGDIRVGYDGTTYETAGEAVRAQAKAAAETARIKLFQFVGSPTNGFTLKNTTYAELKELYDDMNHIALYYSFSDIGAKYYHCAGACKKDGVIGLAFQFCFNTESEWVFVGEDDSVQLGAVSSSGVALDDTLTESGKAADAKAVGDKLGDTETALDGIIAIQNELIGGAGE